MQPSSLELNLKDVQDAQGVVYGAAWRTPVVPASRYDDGKVYLKLECLQRTGSFKIRGAWNRMSRSTKEERARGFVTISAGNHGQAVAWCAQRLGSPCTVYVPEGAVERKISSMESMGAEVKKMPSKEVMDSMADDRMYKMDKTFVHPFADPLVAAGQGTVGLEIIQDLPDVRTVLVPVGGGGLISGIATSLKGMRSGIKVFGIQAQGAAPLPVALSTSRLDELKDFGTVADGIKTNRVFGYMLPILKKVLDGAYTVSDDQILDAMKRIVSEAHVVVEPAGAAAYAAAIAYGDEFERPTVCVASGGNVDPALLARLVSP